MVIAYVGSGGKTTLLKRQARVFRQQGLRVFVTTSTHMFIEPDTLLTDDPEEILCQLQRTGYAMAGIPVGEKIGPLSQRTYRSVCERADVVLLEADGSKHMPIKFPSASEPVLYDNVEKTIIVCGLQALGKPVRETAHRLELVTTCLGISEDALITPAHMVKLVREGYVLPLRKRFPHMELEVWPSHDGSPELISLAKKIAETSLAN